MPGQDRQNPLDRRRRVRLLPGAARGRRQGAGGGAGLRGPRRRCGYPPARRGIRRPRRHRRGARSVLADGAGPARPRRQAHPGALAAAARQDQDRRARHCRHARRICATLPQFNGRAATMGFCYGGPYAILGPKRLGYAAGISCHGTQMLDYIGELDGVTEPVCIIWGDQDHRAPPEVLDAYRPVPSRMKNVEVHIFPGILHGYMMPGAPKAYDQKTRDVLDAADDRDPRRASRRRRDAAQGVVVSRAARVTADTNIAVRPPHDARRGRAAAARPGPLRR